MPDHLAVVKRLRAGLLEPRPVLGTLARDPGLRLRDVAEACDITERSAHRIVSELVEQGYLARKRNGVRNHYEVQPDVPIHDPLLGEHWVGEILAVLAGDVPPGRGRAPELRAADRASTGDV